MTSESSKKEMIRITYKDCHGGLILRVILTDIMGQLCFKEHICGSFDQPFLTNQLSASHQTEIEERREDGRHRLQKAGNGAQRSQSSAYRQVAWDGIYRFGWLNLIDSLAELQNSDLELDTLLIFTELSRIRSEIAEVKGVLWGHPRKVFCPYHVRRTELGLFPLLFGELRCLRRCESLTREGRSGLDGRTRSCTIDNAVVVRERLSR